MGELGSVNVAGVARKLYVFVAVMSWSRNLFVRFTFDMKLLTWLDAHRAAFTFFGGVPEEVLIDNLKTGVVARAGKNARFHPKYEELAVAFGFRPIAHFPLRPKTKGRVERMVRFVRERFFVGREVTNLDGLNAEAIVWLGERANRRVHRITREKPEDRFVVERERLRPLVDYDLMLEESRVSDPYALVSVDGVRYSIPAKFARRKLTVMRRPERLTFVVDGVIVADHHYAAPGVRLVQDKSHLPPRVAPRHERFANLGERVVECFGELGRRYVERVEATAPHAPLAILGEVLDRESEFGRTIVTAALEDLVQFQVVKRGALSRLCYRRGSPSNVPMAATSVVPTVTVSQRPLAVYDEVLL